MKKPRTWDIIIRQEGVTGLLAGENIKVEETYKAKMFRRKTNVI